MGTISSLQDILVPFRLQFIWNSGSRSRTGRLWKSWSILLQKTQGGCTPYCWKESSRLAFGWKDSVLRKSRGKEWNQQDQERILYRRKFNRSSSCPRGKILVILFIPLFQNLFISLHLWTKIKWSCPVLRGNLSGAWRLPQIPLSRLLERRWIPPLLRRNV